MLYCLHGSLSSIYCIPISGQNRDVVSKLTCQPHIQTHNQQEILSCIKTLRLAWSKICRRANQTRTRKKINEANLNLK